jgi:hypothetical protein
VPTIQVAAFTDLQDTFFSYVRDIKYATVITIDRESQPRARILLPVWDVTPSTEVAFGV